MGPLLNVQDLLAATVADKAWNSKQGRLIISRINKLFKNFPQTEYQVGINYYAPDKGYSLFFSIKKKGTYQRSIPLARYPNLSFTNLLAILTVVRQTYHFTFTYTNFTSEQRKQLYRKVDRQ